MNCAPRLESGIVCALVTPFRPDGSPDVGALGTLIDFQMERGVHALFVLGTTGEGVLCSPSERKELAEFCLERVAGRVAVVVHCGAVDTGTAVDLVRHAASVGATAVAATAPFFFAYPEAALYEHFARLAYAAPDLDHYVYDNPERVGFAVGVPLVKRLVKEIEPIVGVKDTGDSLGKVTQYLTLGSASPRVFVGNNVIGLGALVMGARGVVSATSNAAPELFVAMHKAFSDGRLEDARRLQLIIAQLQAAVTGLPYIGAVKHLVTRRGLSGGCVRSPLPGLTGEQARLLDERLAANAELQEWLKPVF